MQYQVFVQNLAAQRFVASVMEMPIISEYGATEEAVSKATEVLVITYKRDRERNIDVPRTEGMYDAKKLIPNPNYRE